MELIKGYTHNGFFHYDEVLCTVLMRRLFKGIEICRVGEITDEMRQEPNTIIFDIGFGEFDHHQEDGKRRNNGIKYSAFGLLWKEFGKKYLKMLPIDDVDKFFKEFDKMIVQNIDDGDNNGYRYENSLYDDQLIIKSLYPTWLELKEHPKLEETSFWSAVEFAEKMFNIYLRNVYKEVVLKPIEREIWNQSDRIPGGIMVLKENIDWRPYARNEGISLVITKSQRGGYMLKLTDPRFPIVENELMDFIPPSKNICICNDLDKAVECAQKVVKQYKRCKKEYESRYWW